MERPEQHEQPPPRRFRYRPAVPSWLASAVLHGLAFVILALLLPERVRQGAATERTADVGIVLRQTGEDGGEYFEGDPGDKEAASSADQQAVSAAQTALDELLERPPVDPDTLLPAPLGIIGPQAEGGQRLASASGALRGTGGPGAGAGGAGGLGSGKGKTRFFGVEGEGFKFVYVLDRSGSMGGSGRNPLEAAKAELITSLESLERVHQFQIIFYNENPVVFNPAGTPGALAFADDRTRSRARQFIASIMADGGTRHEAALMMAINLQPDVIFFLTDADDPKLSAAQLERIRRRAAGITINTVEFGLGPKSGDTTFLEKLARQNGGNYGYIDIASFRRP